MSAKNLKHGIKITKRDYVLKTAYVVMLRGKMFCFETKMEAINFISEIISKDCYLLSDFTLTKTQLIKI